MSTCTIPACDRKAVAKGLCEMHRKRRELGIPDDQLVQAQRSREEWDALLPGMIEMWERGATAAEIGKTVGRSAAAVLVVLKRAGVGPKPTAIPHGRPSAWVHHKCRCEICMEARRAYRREERTKRLAKDVAAEHGTLLAHNQGCRCVACREAMAAYLRERQQRTREGAVRHGRAWQQWEAEIAFDTSMTIEERARRIGRTYAAVDNFIRLQLRRPDDPYRVK